MFILLGMHKSGTTLLAEMLHHAGIEMVEDASSRGYDEGNHFERMSTRSINKRLLDCADTVSFRVRNVAPSAVALPAGSMQELDAEARRVVVDVSTRTGENWGFKDPRTCLTYDFWARRIPEHRLILVFRDPAEVFGHYVRKEARLQLSDYIEILRSWHSHNREILRIFQANRERSILFDFNEFMRDAAELARLERFVGRPIPDMRAPSMLRSSARKTLRYRLAELVCRLGCKEDLAALHDMLRAQYVDSRKSAHDLAS